MDYEDYLSTLYTPLKSIELMSNIIYEKSNSDWELFSKHKRQDAEELLALNFAIRLCTKYLLEKRQKEVDNLYNSL